MLLNPHELNPSVLRAVTFNGYGPPPVLKMSPRVCYDYELEYYLQSDGGIRVNGTYIPFQAGEINFRKPGQIVQGVPTYRCHIICVRMNGAEPPRKGYIFGEAEHAQPEYDNPLLSSLPDRICLKNPQYMEQIFREICRLFPKKDDLSLFRSHQLLFELFYELFSQMHSEHSLKTAGITQVAEAVNKISASFCDPINVAGLIRDSGLSKAYFHKCFRQYTGKTPVELITSLRMEKAKTLLCMTDNPVAEISSVCGYDDPVYFSYLFKRSTGISPTQYRTLRTPRGSPGEK